MSARPRLTTLERRVLREAAAFVLAGEWPVQGDGTAADDAQINRDRAALQRALDKLSQETPT